MHVYSFEKLEIWRIAKGLVVTIYDLTDCFPSAEKYGMVSQIRRAATSVPSNLAEGTCRNTARDQAYFYGVAYSSLIELLNHLLIARDMEWISESDLLKVRNVIEGLSYGINSLRKSILLVK